MLRLIYNIVDMVMVTYMMAISRMVRGRDMVSIGKANVTTQHLLSMWESGSVIGYTATVSWMTF